MLSKFINKSAQKLSIFSSKANYARGLFFLISIFGIGFTEEEQLIKQVHAHITIKDFVSARTLITEEIKNNPQSKPLIEAQIQVLAKMGYERQMLEAWKNYTTFFPDQARNREIIETMAWGVIQKGSTSPSPLIRLITLLAAFFSQDMQGVCILNQALSDTNTLIRQTAVKLAPDMRDEKLKKHLLHLLHKEMDWKVHISLIQSMGDMQLLASKPYLMDLMTDPQKTVEEKQTAVLSLVALSESISQDELKTLVSSPHSSLRTLGCQIVIALQPQGVENLMIPLIKDESAEVRAAAWQALGVLNIPNIPLQSMQEMNPETKVSIAWYTLLHNASLGQKMMKQLLQSDDKDTRRLAAGAVRAAGSYGTPLALELFNETKDAYLKINLALALISQRQEVEKATNALYQVYMENKERWMETDHPLFPYIAPSDLKFTDNESIENYPEVVDQLTRLELLNILAIFKNEHAKDAIESFLQNKDWGITGLASALLLTEGDESTLELIRNLLDSPVQKIQIQAALILALWGKDEKALTTLMSAYPKSTREMKEHILEGLCKVGADSTLSFLIDRLSEPYQSLRIIAALGILQTLYH